MNQRVPLGTDTNGLFLGDLQLGSLVGAYRVNALHSARGSGVVYRATHAVLPRHVLLKILPSTDALQEQALQLLREACIVEALDHPGITRIYETGLLPDHRPWVAAEIIEGTPLNNILHRDPMTAIEVADLLVRISDILEHAHRRGVVHCGLTPAAIVVPHNGRRFPYCIADWSDARTMDSASPLPLVPRLPARPYQAPEQRELQTALDPAVDIYALGRIAHHALFGTLTPRAPTTMLARLIERMTDADPACRPTIQQVHEAARSLCDVVALDADDGSDVDVDIAFEDEPGLDIEIALPVMEIEIDL